MQVDLAAKHSIWALQARCHMLYTSCLSVHHDESISEYDKGQFSVQAWLESEQIKQMLDAHTCDIEGANRMFSPFFVRVKCQWTHYPLVYFGRQILFEYARYTSTSSLSTN
jgi:hypothetical protein